MKNDNTSVDIDFAEAAVPHYARRGIVTMFMIMLGFTFFSASMWVGKELADGLDFSGFIISMIIGGLITGEVGFNIFTIVAVAIIVFTIYMLVRPNKYINDNEVKIDVKKVAASK